MENRWESILVAFGIIAIFYFAKKYIERKKPPLLGKDAKHYPVFPSKKENKTQAGIKGLRKKPKKYSHSSSSNHMAALVMHPHSMENARKEFYLNAHRFCGSYESLFLVCNGKVTGVFREQVFRNWEEGIRGTEAKFLILVWTTIVQKHSGRNFYRQGVPRWNRDAKQENEILQDWLKQLFKWGILRELCSHSLSPELEEDAKGRGETTRWKLNGEIVEEGQEQVKLTGQ